MAIHYNELFNRYQDCQTLPGDKSLRDRLTLALLPCIELWASDVLASAHSRVNRNWRQDVIATGCLKIVARMESLENCKFTDGKHLVNSFRLSATNAMKRMLDERFSVPMVKPETIKQRIGRNEPAYLPGELRKQLDLILASRQKQIGSTNRVTFVDPRFFDRDPRSSYRWFVNLACQEACKIARELGWTFVELMYEQDLSPGEVAALVGMPRRTIADRLGQLAGPIVASASSELDELGMKYLGKSWVEAAKNNLAGHRTNGESTPPNDAGSREIILIAPICGMPLPMTSSVPSGLRSA